MNRRSLLKALPAAVVAGAAPAAALCVVDPAETPVMRMFRQWVAEETRLNGEEGRTMPESQFNADLFAQNVEQSDYGSARRGCARHDRQGAGVDELRDI